MAAQAPHEFVLPRMAGKEKTPPLIPVPTNLSAAELMAAVQALEFLGHKIHAATAGLSLEAAFRLCVEKAKALQQEDPTLPIAAQRQRCIEGAAWSLYVAGLLDKFKDAKPSNGAADAKS